MYFTSNWLEYISIAIYKTMFRYINVVHFYEVFILYFEFHIALDFNGLFASVYCFFSTQCVCFFLFCFYISHQSISHLNVCVFVFKMWLDPEHRFSIITFISIRLKICKFYLYQIDLLDSIYKSLLWTSEKLNSRCI